MRDGKLVLIRHGMSEWNEQNLFTGWADPDLADQGIIEATKAGELLSDTYFDDIFSSPLIRAHRTAKIVLSQSKQSTHLNEDDITLDDRIRERNYGDLKGFNKQEMADKFGKEQVKIWRRSYDVAPPNGESLHDVVLRITPFYNEILKPKMMEGRSVLLSAHGNALRALFIVMGLHDKDQIMTVEVPTGKPFFFTYDQDSQNWRSK